MKRCMGALTIVCMLLAGCVSPATRLEMAENSEKERDLEILTVGDVTYVDNVAPLIVQGVGLVTGLNGTGHCPSGYYRNVLEQYLLKNMGGRGGEIANDQPEIKVKKLLDDPNNALVIVTGRIAAGSRRGDLFDVEVTLPDEGSLTSSLAGGYLQVTQLRMYEQRGHLSQRHSGDMSVVGSHVLAQAKGALIVGFGKDIDAEELKKGQVWLGGMSRVDRPYNFVLRMDEKYKSMRLSNGIAERINFLFQDNPLSKPFRDQMKLLESMTDQLNQQGNPAGNRQTDMAKAIDKNRLNVSVPLIYRLNHEHYMLVARATPLQATDQDLARYQKRLQKMLQDPRDTVRAAIRLEAMGRGSIPILKEGLQSEHALVRFSSAEALAYLGSTYGIDTLAEVAKAHPLFAYHAALAMANLKETVCLEKLKELLRSPEPDVRNAAFHALALDDEKSPQLGGLHVNQVFWLYRLPLSPTPTIYYSANTRAQVILCGPEIALAPDTRLTVGKDFILAIGKDDDTCVIQRMTTRGDKKRTCYNRLDEILVTLATFGATYPDVIDFLKKAADQQSIHCPIVPWTNPDVPLEKLVKEGRGLK